MPSTDKLPTDLLSQLEQVEAYLLSVSVLLGSYYKELIKNGVPHDLACEIVSYFNELWWSKVWGEKLK